MPTSVEEALRLLAEWGPGARIIAGGTETLVELRRGARQVEVLIDVTRIGGLDHVEVDRRGRIRVGAALTALDGGLTPRSVRGMGEMPFIAFAPALAAAVHDATGVWFGALPLTPERVLDGVEGRVSDASGEEWGDV
jgi:hypothetical protein